jgi:hypothetical protein
LSPTVLDVVAEQQVTEADRSKLTDPFSIGVG